ncbi:MAG: hypothetical protein BWY19_01017 [bacterium ADurb.Bin212]|nr:MAG: hypothetical protein BWY19_01017 [bacterium ADurb.Bin212]
MPDEWVCDECGYSTTLEPEDNKCPGCNAKMTKIDSADDIDKDDDSYDDDDLATPIDEDDDFSWEEDKEDEKKK